jgi:hypothetical protein
MVLQSYGHYEHFHRYFLKIKWHSNAKLSITLQQKLTVSYSPFCWSWSKIPSNIVTQHYTFDPDGWVWPIVTWVTNGPCVRPVILLTLEPTMLTPLFPWVWWFDWLTLWTIGTAAMLIMLSPPLRLFCWSMSCTCEDRICWLLPFMLSMWVLLLDPYFELLEDWYGCL